ncbi:membrane dipeptidase [Flavobacterium sp. ANB]|uniref:dipeptidase n=1 Tax=unclassified Flavobacterium TaxID=196869 RepID=UPI0012B84753|nr:MULTISPECIES: membrane dipeptidase [unclassified Flavobacterium]MBF4517129.1 membrane dipeptidase [Flavobacterium sp. ANB]MTD71866.1 peptidase M19 [Flavobacterium sp. LC2016-13]
MEKTQQDWSRRKFMYTLTGAGTLIMLNPMITWAAETFDPRVAAIVAKTIGIDTHNHVDVPLNATELPGPKIDLIGEMKKSGLSAICMTFAVDYQELKNPGDAYNRFLNGLTAMDKILESNNMTHSMNLADIQFAYKNHIPTVIQSVEGAHFLEGNLDRLGIAYNKGLRHLTLLHDHDASVPLGDVFTNPAQFGGLTTFGADVIKKCNQLGIVVDLSHANNETLNAALKVTTKPVLVSHTGLDTQLGKNEFMNKMMRPRLISKEQAKIVAETGGVIGVWTHLADSPLEYAQNIKAMVDVVGIDHVAIGTDTKLTPPYRSPESIKQQQGEPQKGGDKNKMDGGTNETWKDQKEGFYYVVVDALLKTGFNEEEIGKIGGGNFLRVFDAATKGQSIFKF